MEDVQLAEESPAPSPSSDSDAYNTADARIHFGPFRSPEKMLVHMPERNVPPPDPLDLSKHTPRLSSLHQQTLALGNPEEAITQANPIEVEDALEWKARTSHQQTPENDQGVQDEPSSVLASRVILAHDNPSPPPSDRTSIGLDDLAPLSKSPLLSPLPLSTFSEIKHNQGKRIGSGSSTPVGGRHLDGVARPGLTPFDSFTPKNVFRSTLTSDIPPSPHPGFDLANDIIAPSPGFAYLIQHSQASSLIWSERIDSPGGYRQARTAFEATSESGDEQAVADTLFSIGVNRSSAGSPQPRLLLSSKQDLNFQLDETTDASMDVPMRHVNSIGSGALPNADNSMNVMPTNPLPETQAEEHQENEPTGTLSEILDLSQRKKGSAEVDNGTMKEEKREKKDLSRSPPEAETRHEDYRKLGSLSPSSTNLLTHLLPLPTRQNTTTQSPAQPSLQDVPCQDPPIFMAPTIPNVTLPQTPRRSISPMRFPSPVRPNSLQTPRTARLTYGAPNDPNRTPARRILIQEAVVQGHISPQKAARLATEGTRGAILSIPSTDSPARRVIAPETPIPSTSKIWQGIRFGSPSRQRSASIEPQPTIPAVVNGMQRHASVQRQPMAKNGLTLRPQAAGASATSASTSGAHRPPVKLPFPIVPSRPILPSSISEEFEPEDRPYESKVDSPAKLSGPSSSPTKSLLRQPISKIPRGVKPYARPISKLGREKGQTTTVVRAVDLSKPGTSGKAVSTSKEVATHLLLNPPRSGMEPGTSNHVSAPTLKRKRLLEQSSPPRNSQYGVTSGKGPRNVVQTSKPTVAVRPNKATPQLIRRVVGQQVEVLSPPHAVTNTDEDLQNLQLDGDSGARTRPDNVVASEITLSSSPLRERSPPPPINQPLLVGPKLPTESESSNPSTRRRTTRVRKVVSSGTAATDVSGGLLSRTPQSRRRGNTQITQPDDVFSGMSAVALKALTSSNTIRNQKYLAAKLETKVIRKEGVRPESPAVKVRTILQREKDERGKQRKERAARRAKRGEDGMSSGLDQDEQDGDADIADSSDWDDQNSSPLIGRHKRGPGDEEDYETPIKLNRQAKRPRLGDEEMERRVKWDRGLFTTIFADELKVGSRPPPIETSNTKGCLAPAAKAAPLDNLGNLPNADAPLTELVEESIVVKKFVYDNDVEALPPVVVVKNTRLRSKKAKS